MNTASETASSFVLGINALQSTALAADEAARGCQYILIMNDFGGAGDLKRAFPNAIVMARRWFYPGVFPSVDQVIAGLEGAQHGALVYIGINEGDQIGQRGGDLRQRARLDVAVAQRIKQLNPAATYAAGTFSMGTPEFNSAEDCQIIREEYAPHYNSGLLGFDMHLYSPNMQHIDQPGEHIWFERRWEFLFTRCGFDPRVRSIFCSECGLDEGGVGGFPAHGASQAYFRDWCAKYIALQSAPLMINGVAYPSPIRGGAIFQLGGNSDPRWEGYNIASYLPQLRPYYSGIALPTATPTRTVTPTPEATAALGFTVASRSYLPALQNDPSPTATLRPSATSSRRATRTPTSTRTRVPTLSPLVTPTPTVTQTPTVTPTPSVTAIPTQTPAP
jgi:hypothetical protein